MPTEKKAASELRDVELRQAIRQGLRSQGFADSAARRIANDATDAAEMVIYGAQNGEYD
jgi:hypothetical protein